MNKFCVALTLILLTSCSNNNVIKFSPEDAVITIITEDYIRNGERAFLLIENKEGQRTSTEIFNNKNIEITRGNEFNGSFATLHLILYSLENQNLKVNSYYSYDIRETITLKSRLTSPQEAKLYEGQVNVQFTDVPDFDIAVRSAMHPAHCHVTNTLDPPVCSPNNEFIERNGDKRFYTCLINKNEAKYHIENIGLDESGTYNISLANMNGNMESFNYYTMIGGLDINMLSVMLNSKSNKSLQVFNYKDPSIYKEDKISVFVPELEQEGEFYSMGIGYGINSKYGFRNYHRKKMLSDIALINADLSVEERGNEIEINVLGDFNHIKGEMVGDNLIWTYFVNESVTINVFKLPLWISNSIGIDYSEYSFKRHMCVAVNYPEHEVSYNEVLNKSIAEKFVEPDYIQECYFNQSY